MFYLWFLDVDNKCFSPHHTCLTIVQLYHVSLVGVNRECLMSFYVNGFLHVCRVYTALLCMQKIVRFTEKYKIIATFRLNFLQACIQCGACSTIVYCASVLSD